MSEKRYSEAEAWAVARPLALALEQVCERVEIAGSLRRRRPNVGDIELLFIPRCVEVKSGLFDTALESQADRLIEGWLKEGLLAKRPSKVGVFTWGEKNKLAVHVPSGIPVDLFSTTQLNWWNSLVCRTGGKTSNLQITNGALRRGWSFEAYGSGFHRVNDETERYDTTSEEDVFRFVGLPYVPPERRP